MTENKMISIQIIEDCALIKNSLKYLLNTFDNFEVTNCFSSVNEFLNQENMQNPNIVIVDLNFYNSNGVKEITTIKKILPDTKIAVFSRNRTDNNLSCCKDYDLHLSLQNDYFTIPKKIKEMFSNL